MKQIDEKILIADLIAQYPQAAEILVTKYGFHCIGCMAAHEETLGEGAMVHGFSKKEIKDLIKTLRETVVQGKVKKK